jgi:hypothetical protein
MMTMLPNLTSDYSVGVELAFWNLDIAPNRQKHLRWSIPPLLGIEALTVTVNALAAGSSLVADRLQFLSDGSLRFAPAV